MANIKQSKRCDYRRSNDEGTANLVAAARKAGARHFIHLGGLNTVPGKPGSYTRTRFDAEQHVRTGGIPYSILQPSILFGDGSAFFTALAGLARRSPVVPVPGSGTMKFQPIWVEDVVTCLTRLLAEDGRDETVQVGGPAQYTYDQLLDLIFSRLGKRRLKLHMPLPLMRVATAAMQIVLPKPPVTTATLELFDSKTDNTTALDAVQARFGFLPRALEQGLKDDGF